MKLDYTITKFESSWMKKRLELAINAYKYFLKHNFYDLCLTDIKTTSRSKKATESKLFLFSEPYPMLAKEVVGDADEIDIINVIQVLLLRKQSPCFPFLYKYGTCMNCVFYKKVLPCNSFVIEVVKSSFSEATYKTISQQFAFLCHMFLALHAMHSINIIHDDLKFNNILTSTTFLKNKHFRYILNVYDDVIIIPYSFNDVSNVSIANKKVLKTKTFNVPVLDEMPIIIDFDKSYSVEQLPQFQKLSHFRKDVLKLMACVGANIPTTYKTVKFHPNVTNVLNLIATNLPEYLTSAVSVFQIIHSFAKFRISGTPVETFQLDLYKPTF